MLQLKYYGYFFIIKYAYLFFKTIINNNIIIENLPTLGLLYDNIIVSSC